jgi:hypothetical protein
LIVAALCALWLWYLYAAEARLFWTLAVSSMLVLLASGFLRNGYVPWASLWAIAAITEAFSVRHADQLPNDGAPLVINNRIAAIS